MDIQLTFLGTSDSIPTALRNHTSMLLEYGSESILIDCGEGTQRQLRKKDKNPCKITKILLTHKHADHVLGLPGLLQTLQTQSYSKKLSIYGPRGIKKHIEIMQELYGKLGLNIEIHESSDIIVETEEYILESKPMDHSSPTNAYSFIVKDKIKIRKEKLVKHKIPNTPLLKKLSQGKDVTINGIKCKAKDFTYIIPGKKITVILDTKMNENAIKIAKKADVLICEATYAETESAYASEYKHLTASQAGIIAKKAGVKKLVLTHIAQRYEHSLQHIASEAKKKFTNVTIANDLDTLCI